MIECPTKLYFDRDCTELLEVWLFKKTGKNFSNKLCHELTHEVSVELLLNLSKDIHQTLTNELDDLNEAICILLK